VLPCVGVEFFNEVRPAVEVSIDFAADERVVFVVFLNVWLTVEIRVDIDFREISAIIEPKPHIGPVVTVSILGSETSSRRMHCQDRTCGARNDTQCGDPLGKLNFHEIFRISAIFRVLQVGHDRIASSNYPRFHMVSTGEMPATRGRLRLCKEQLETRRDPGEFERRTELEQHAIEKQNLPVPAGVRRAGLFLLPHPHFCHRY
jgi:hypothetical protein